MLTLRPAQCLSFRPALSPGQTFSRAAVKTVDGLCGGGGVKSCVSDGYGPVDVHVGEAPDAEADLGEFVLGPALQDERAVQHHLAHRGATTVSDFAIIISSIVINIVDVVMAVIIIGKASSSSCMVAVNICLDRFSEEFEFAHSALTLTGLDGRTSHEGGMYICSTESLVALLLTSLNRRCTTSTPLRQM
jgi:hypothetical protein